MIGGAMGQDPFRDYLTESYVRAIRLGKFAIYLKKDSQPRRPSNIWLLYGARDFATSSGLSQSNLIHGKGVYTVCPFKANRSC